MSLHRWTPKPGHSLPQQLRDYGDWLCEWDAAVIESGGRGTRYDAQRIVERAADEIERLRAQR